MNKFVAAYATWGQDPTKGHLQALQQAAQKVADEFEKVQEGSTSRGNPIDWPTFDKKVANEEELRLLYDWLVRNNLILVPNKDESEEDDELTEPEGTNAKPKGKGGKKKKKDEKPSEYPCIHLTPSV